MQLIKVENGQIQQALSGKSWEDASSCISPVARQILYLAFVLCLRQLKEVQNDPTRLVMQQVVIFSLADSEHTG